MGGLLSRLRVVRLVQWGLNGRWRGKLLLRGRWTELLHGLRVNLLLLLLLLLALLHNLGDRTGRLRMLKFKWLML